MILSLRVAVATSIMPIGWLWLYIFTKLNFPSVKASLATRCAGFILFIKKGHLLGTKAQRLQDLNANKVLLHQHWSVTWARQTVDRLRSSDSQNKWAICLMVLCHFIALLQARAAADSKN